MDIYDLPVSYPNLAVVFIAGIVVLQYLPGDELYRDIISLYKVKSSAKTCSTRLAQPSGPLKDSLPWSKSVRGSSLLEAAVLIKAKLCNFFF